MELNTIYKPQLSKEKRDERRQKGLCYKYSLPGY
jgi:hypothetical protein